MNKKVTALLAGAALFSGSSAFAGGFALLEQSVSALGTAFAGTAATAEDASYMYFNPAQLTRLCGREGVAGFHIVIPSADYDDDGSLAVVDTDFTPPFPPGPLIIGNMSGNDGRNAGEAALVGNAYWSWRYSRCLAFGLGINAPFGLVTDYDNDWKGRYQAIRSAILTININPAIAYRFNRCWSIGAGLNVMYMHAKLTNKIDFGLLGNLLTGSDLLFGIPQQNDAFVKLKGNSWGFGGNVGILYEPSPCTRFGLAWRSEVKHVLKGSEDFDDLPVNIGLIPAVAAQFEDTRVKANITLPQSVIFSAYHAFNRCWAVVGDVQWTKWDILNRVRFRFNNENQADQILTLNWENSWRGAIGAIYTPNCNWKFRGGFAYDQDPTPDKEFRTPRLPGQDRFWLALGAGYNYNRCWHVDVGYAHLFVKEAKIDQTDEFLDAVEDFTPGDPPNSTLLRGGLRGKWDAHVDIVSAQLVYKF